MEDQCPVCWNIKPDTKHLLMEYRIVTGLQKTQSRWIQPNKAGEARSRLSAMLRTRGIVYDFQTDQPITED